MAMVYRGLDLQSRRTVALKILHETNRTPSACAGYFLQEARITSLLRHPHIVRVYDRGQHNDLSFLVLEFIEGRSLCQELQTQPVLSVKRALTIAHAVALALLVQLEDAAEDECALSPLSLQREEKETPGCDGDDDLVIAPISSEVTAGTSHHIALQIVAGMCGFIVLIVLSIYLTLHLM